MTRGIDRTSIEGKEFPTEDHFSLVVIGAGATGVAAAIEAARLGMRVLLVDEHPVSSTLVGLDVPYMFGERMTGAVQNKPRMLERVVAARPDMERAFDAGIDVRLGVYAWGAFIEGPTSRALPGRLLALADEERSWLVQFDRLIVAAGARDLALAFPGWDRPGVMGAQAFGASVGLYDAFAGRRVLVLGAGALGLHCVHQAQAAGIAVAGVVDAGPATANFSACVVPLHANARISGVSGTDALSVTIAGRDRSLDVACDTIVCAIDTVPNVEMFDLLGCRMAWNGAAGGHLPAVDDVGRTSVAGVYAAGDCAGVSEAGIGDGARAGIAGRRAAQAAALDAGLAATIEAAPPALPGADGDARRRHWLQAHADPQLLICRCEEVTQRDLLGVRPPGYLEYIEEKFAHRDLRTLAADGPVNQDQIKRLTRAGMGACQGRRCREQVQALLAMQGNQATGTIAMPSYRAPLRPLPLSVLSAQDETAAVRANWTAWFGIAGQWLPHWEPVPDNPEYEGGRIFSDVPK
jgi:thioredoxin reductase